MNVGIVIVGERGDRTKASLEVLTKEWTLLRTLDAGPPFAAKLMYIVILQCVNVLSVLVEASSGSDVIKQASEKESALSDSVLPSVAEVPLPAVDRSSFVTRLLPIGEYTNGLVMFLLASPRISVGFVMATVQVMSLLLSATTILMAVP